MPRVSAKTLLSIEFEPPAEQEQASTVARDAAHGIESNMMDVLTREILRDMDAPLSRRRTQGTHPDVRRSTTTPAQGTATAAVRDAWEGFMEAEDQRLLARMREASMQFTAALSPLAGRTMFGANRTLANITQSINETAPRTSLFVLDSLGTCGMTRGQEITAPPRAFRGRTQLVAMADEFSTYGEALAIQARIEAQNRKRYVQSTEQVLARFQSAREQAQTHRNQPPILMSNATYQKLYGILDEDRVLQEQRRQRRELDRVCGRTPAIPQEPDPERTAHSMMAAGYLPHKHLDFVPLSNSQS